MDDDYRFWPSKTGEIDIKEMSQSHIRRCIDFLSKKIEEDEFDTYYIYKVSLYDRAYILDDMQNWIMAFEEELKRRKKLF